MRFGRAHQVYVTYRLHSPEKVEDLRRQLGYDGFSAAEKESTQGLTVQLRLRRGTKDQATAESILRLLDGEPEVVGEAEPRHQIDGYRRRRL